MTDSCDSPTTRRASAPLTFSAILTAFRRHECEFSWSVYDAQFAGSPSGAFVDGA